MVFTVVSPGPNFGISMVLSNACGNLANHDGHLYFLMEEIADYFVATEWLNQSAYGVEWVCTRSVFRHTSFPMLFVLFLHV